MKYLNYELEGISSRKLAEKAKVIISKMKHNAHFPRPYPSLEELYSISSELESIQDKIDGGAKNQIPLLQEKFVCLKRKLKQLGTYVMVKSQGNPYVVKSSGFKVTDKPEARVTDSLRII